MRRRFLKDYVSNEKGPDRFRYVGSYYIFRMDAEEKKKRAALQTAAGAGMLALLFGAGLLNSPGSYKPYIVLPYLCMILPLLYYIGASFHFRRIPERMERCQYEESILRMMKSVLAVFFLNVFVLAADGIFLVFGPEEMDKKAETAFFFILTVTGICSYLGMLYHNRMMKQVEAEQQETQQ